MLFVLSFLLAPILLLTGCIGETSDNEEAANGVTRLPPGPECPDGEFMAGAYPHLICMDEERFNSLYGEAE